MVTVGAYGGPRTMFMIEMENDQQNDPFKSEWRELYIPPKSHSFTRQGSGILILCQKKMLSIP